MNMNLNTNYFQKDNYQKLTNEHKSGNNVNNNSGEEIKPEKNTLNNILDENQLITNKSTTEVVKTLSTSEMLNLHNLTFNKTENYKKEDSKNNDMTKDELLSMGFNEEEINKYFYSTQSRLKNENGEYVLPDGAIDRFALKTGLQINGRSVNSLEDLKYELFEAPITELKNKVRAGIVSQEQILEELQKLGASDVEVEPIENDSLDRTIITYTYRGVTDSFIPQNLTVVKSPQKDNEKSEISLMDYKPYSRETLRAYGFTDSDFTKYFDKHNLSEPVNNLVAAQARSRASKDGNYYQLKTDIVISGYKIKSIQDLYYYIVLSRLK